MKVCEGMKESVEKWREMEELDGLLVDKDAKKDKK